MTYTNQPDPNAAFGANGAPQSSSQPGQGFSNQAPQGAAFGPSSAASAPYAAYAAPGATYGAYGASQAPARKSHGWIVAIVVVIALLAVTLVGIVSCSSAIGSLSSNMLELDGLDIEGDSIAVIPLDGTIQYDGSECSPEGLLELLDRAENDSRVKAVVLRVNSGGGVATAGEEMAQYVRNFSKPIVVSSASLNASAAYEISAQADYIFVAKTTEIGAIGTVMQVTDLSGLFEKLGISMDAIASADSKDSSYGTRPLTDEERAYYQAMVDELNETFIQNVAEGRGLPTDQVRALATGLPFAGTTAVKNGIADEVGTREDAFAKAAELAGIREYHVFDLKLDDYGFYDLMKFMSDEKLEVRSGLAGDIAELVGADDAAGRGAVAHG